MFAIITSMIDKELKYFIEYLKKDENKHQTSGLKYHLALSPRLGDVPLRSFKAKSDAKRSAVMLLLRANKENELEIMFTLRSEKLRNHSGQISFPGGRIEDGETALLAAFRETNEETGIGTDKIEYLCQLSELYVPPSNSIIYPFVGLIDADIEMNISFDEVEKVFFKNIAFFCDESNLKFEQKNMEGNIIDVPYWEVGERVNLWGATAMMLNEFVGIYKKYISNSSLG